MENPSSSMRCIISSAFPFLTASGLINASVFSTPITKVIPSSQNPSAARTSEGCAAMSFTGGKLKLKGDTSLSSGGKRKKRRRKNVVDRSEQESETKASDSEKAARLGETPDGFKLPEPSPGDDRRTEAEKVYDEKMAKREEEQIKHLAVKSHRERVKEFNEYLANLTEHHDIPKVGPG